MDCNDCRKDEMKMDLIWNEIVTEEDMRIRNSAMQIASKDYCTGEILKIIESLTYDA